MFYNLNYKLLGEETIYKITGPLSSNKNVMENEDTIERNIGGNGQLRNVNPNYCDENSLIRSPSIEVITTSDDSDDSDNCNDAGDSGDSDDCSDGNQFIESDCCYDADDSEDCNESPKRKRFKDE